MKKKGIQRKIHKGHSYYYFLITFGLLLKSRLPSFIAESNCIIYYNLLSLLLTLSLSQVYISFLSLSLIPLKLMARGGGLSIDSDPTGSFFHHKPIVLNSFPEDNNNIISSNSHHPKWKLGHNMDGTVNKRSSNSSNTPNSTTIPFQVNLSCSHDSHASSPPSDHDHNNNNNRPLIDEMDFFSSHHNKNNDNFASASTSAPHTHDHHSPTPAILELKVNVSDP